MKKYWSVVGLILLLFGSIGLANTRAVPEIDPSREWLGVEYADAIFSEFTRRHPDVKLVIDEKDIEMELESQRLGLKKLIQSFKESWVEAGDPHYNHKSYLDRLVTTVRSTLPSSISEMTRTLEFGEEIALATDKPTHWQLYEWIMSQPDHSITPHELMIEALRLADGRVLKAWGTVWNVTSGDWELAPTRNYRALTHKFVSLTGERHLWQGGVHYVLLPEKEWHDAEVYVRANNMTQEAVATKRFKRIVTKRGDEFSYLYHRVGVELFSILIAKISGSSKVGWVAGTAGAVGEFLKYPATAGLQSENKKRINNDKLAANSGAHFYRLVTGKAKPHPLSIKQGVWNYLVSNRAKFGHTYQLADGRPTHYHASSIDKKFFSPTMSVEELEMRFYHATHVDSMILEPISIATTGEVERLHRGLTEYMKSGAKNENLNNYLRKWIAGDSAEPKIEDLIQDINLSDTDNMRMLDQVDEFEFAEYERWLANLAKKVLDRAQATRIQAAPKSTSLANTATGSAASCKAIFVSN